MAQPPKKPDPFGPGGPLEGKRYQAPKGTRPPNIRELARAKAKELDIDPLEILLKLADNRFEELYPPSELGRPGTKQFIPADVRMKAAAEAVKYIYPALKSVEHTGEGGNPLEVYMNMGQDRLEARLQELERMLGNDAKVIPGEATPVPRITDQEPDDDSDPTAS